MKSILATVWSQALYLISLWYLDSRLPHDKSQYTDNELRRQAQYQKYANKSIDVHNKYVRTQWLKNREQVRVKIALSRTYHDARTPRDPT